MTIRLDDIIAGLRRRTVGLLRIATLGVVLCVPGFTPGWAVDGAFPYQTAQTLVPSYLVSSAMRGNAEDMDQIRAYIRGNDRDKEAAAGRAYALSQAVATSQTRNTDPRELRAAVNRVIDAATDVIVQPEFVALHVNEEYKLPTETGFGWDFGVPESGTREGFTEVGPNTRYIDGIDIMPLRLDDTEEPLFDGLIGVREFERKIPPGVYRLALVTSDVGESFSRGYPFGALLVVNDQEYHLTPTDSLNWVQKATLGGETDDTEQNYARGETASLIEVAQQLYVRGGAIIIEVDLPTGELKLEFYGPNRSRNFRTFISAIIVSDLDEEWDFDLSPDAENALSGSEFEIIATLLDGTAPFIETLTEAAGDGDAGDGGDGAGGDSIADGTFDDETGQVSES